MQPQLRPLEMKWVVQNRQRLLMLRDPLRITENVAFLPPEVAYLLSFCDGQRNAAQISAALAVQTGLRLSRHHIEHVIQQLDDALMLDSPRFATAYHAAVDTYRNAPFRPPALAGTSYPADAEELKKLFDGYMNVLPPDLPSSPTGIRGVLSPHIDYQRGGPTYARVWHAAAAAARAAEVVVILGTDHAGRGGSMTLTRQQYATPLGILPTATDIVDAVEQRVGSDIFDQELHHRYEHSIELAAVWLHYIRRGAAVSVLPVLVGSFHPFTHQDDSLANQRHFNEAIDSIRRMIADRPHLIVSAGDLAHVGPAFGDDEPLDAVAKSVLREHDDRVLAALCTGSADRFFELLHNERDGRRVCGLPPTYLALRLLDHGTGTVVAYDQCPADATGGSVVTVGGVVIA